MDFDIPPFTFQHAANGVLSWLLLVGVIGLLAVVISLLLCVARNGAAGVGIFFKGMLSFLEDVGSLSPTRILALTNLTLKEAIRRKALLVFAVFAVLLMFAGWFLTDSNERAELQVGMHIAFILHTILWLLLPVVFFLSCWSLPEDIRIRSLHTVVTKPARRIEIVLGRIFGMWVVLYIVLISMGAIGYVWIVRQLPQEAKDRLTCRVPLFGHLHFLDRDGMASGKGTNVGDIWEFRSYIEGNSASRGIFTFEGINEAALVPGTETAADGTGTVQVPGLLLECQFEAFRTVKGSESSIVEGIQTQYTISNNPREAAFGLFTQRESLRPLSTALREAQFRNASNRMDEIAAKVAADGESAEGKKDPSGLKPDDYMALNLGAMYAAAVLRERKVPALESAAAAFQKVTDTSSQFMTLSQDKFPPETYKILAQSLTELAVVLNQEADTLHEHLPKLDVVLPSFHMAEYHASSAQNIKFVPRTVRFNADAETLGRTLAKLFQDLNDSNHLVEVDTLNSGLAEKLESEGKISADNASLIVEVIAEQLKSGALKIEGNKLAVADGQRWFNFFDSLIQKNLLNAADSEGWMMERDLIKDLTTNGHLRVEVACLNDQMYLGMARPDLFVRKPDKAFLVGYTKALVSTSLMMMLIIVLGVTISCIVKGPVALFFIFTFFLIGQFFHGFMNAILYDPNQATGAIASAVMGAQHRGPNVGMDVTETTQRVIESIDSVPRALLWGFSQIVPDFTVFNAASGFVEKGFDVPFMEAVVPAFLICLGFLFPCVLIAGALLKFRELESK